MKQNLLALILLLTGLQTVALADTVNGKVQTTRVHGLGVPLNGVVQQVTVSLGDQVSKGDKLLHMDCRSYEIEKNIAQARVDSVAVAANRVRAELDRTLEMYDQDLIAEVEMQDARDRFAEVDAQRRESAAQLQLASLNQRYCILRAPMDGRVVSIATNPGDIVAGQYQSIDLIGLLVHMPPVIIAFSPDSLMVGQQVTILVDGRRVSGILGSVETASGGYRLTVIPEKTGDLSDGKAVTLDYTRPSE